MFKLNFPQVCPIISPVVWPVCSVPIVIFKGNDITLLYINFHQRCLHAQGEWRVTVIPHRTEKRTVCSKAVVLNFFGTRDWFHGRFPQTWGRRYKVEMVSGWFKCITFIVHFISIIITSAPHQIIRHEIPEVGDPCSKKLHGDFPDGPMDKTLHS